MQTKYNPILSEEKIREFLENDDEFGQVIIQ